MRSGRLRFLFLLVCGVAVNGQDTGWITGSVVDPSGAAIAKATVNLMLHGGAKPLATTVTTDQGLFTLQTLRPVYYDLTVDATGFQQYKLENVKVDPSRPTDLPRITLAVSIAGQQVTVTAGLESIQTTSPELSTTVTADQIEGLPVGDRNPLEFISTQAGVSSGVANGYETDINGQRSSFSSVTLDGINIQDNFIRTGDLDFTPIEPLLSEVQEFTVVQSNENASAAGGASQVNFTTPSGTNEFHGTLFWQNRNNSFTANDFFDNQDGNHLPRLNLNQGGPSIGGPIKRDKLFFYATYELFRLKSQQPEDAAVLTPSARQGIFKYINQTTKQVNQANILNLAAGGTGLPADPVMNQLLANVPSFINNTRVGDSLPGTLLNTAGYSYLVRSNQARDQAEGKLDYYINSTNSISATYLFTRDQVDRPDVGVSYSPIPAFQNDDSRHFAALAYRTNPKPNLTNEIRVGGTMSPATFGYLPGTTVNPYLIGGTIYYSPDPLASSPILSQGRNTLTYIGQDNATWTHERHTIKFGAYYQGNYTRSYDTTGTIEQVNVGIESVYQTQNLVTARQLPGVSSTDLDVANSLLASLAGLLDNANQTFNVTSQTSGFVPGAPYLRHFTYSNLAFYGQDEWKILPRLTLTGSLRWDYFSPVNETNSLAVQPLVVGTPEQTLLSDSSLYFTGNSVNRPFYHKDLNNFGPSVGIAWDPFGNGKTSVRAGYSINYVTDEATNVAQGFTGTNPGLATFLQLTDLSGFMSTDRPTFAAPAFQMPLSFDQGYFQNPAAYYALLDPNLRTPYVQNFNLTIQHEIKGTILEARFVGNHATKLLRGFDYNQEKVPASFLQDFLNARQNGFLAQAQTGTFNPAYNPGIAGSKPLPVFAAIAGGGFLGDPTVDSDIQNGEVAELGSLYQVNALVGPYSTDPSLGFFPNPNALSTLFVTNFSNSVYDSLQLEARRRLARGLEFQTNFVWEKWLSDAPGTDEFRLDPFMDINNPKIERARTPVDLTYQYKANFSYELPLGEGHGIHAKGWDRIIGGWTVSGTVLWTSGPPFSIYSGLGTFLREGFSGDNEAIALENMSQLSNQVTFRMSGNGPFMVPASAIGADGRGVAPFGQPAFSGQLFYNPNPNQIGTLQKDVFDGPQIFDMDAKIIKETRINQNITTALFMEALNVFNHPSFFAGDQNINSPQFGKIATQATSPRQIQLGFKVAF